MLIQVEHVCLSEKLISMDATTLREQVVASLHRLVANGTIEIGSAIPSVSALAKEFGVSKSVIREALADLRASGLIRSRQGAATVLQALTPQPGFQLERGIGKDPTELAELYAFRCDVESAAAARAAQHATQHQLAVISSALANLGAEIHNEQSSQLDMELHISIARAAGKYYLRLIESMAGEFGAVVATARTNSQKFADLPVLVHKEHEAIVRAIVQGRPEVAAAAMRRHLVRAALRLTKGVIKTR